MSGLAEVVERQLDELLAEVDESWLSAEPQVRKEYAYLEWDTYTHQVYTVNNRAEEDNLERMRIYLAASKAPQSQDDELNALLRYMESHPDGPPA